MSQRYGGQNCIETSLSWVKCGATSLFSVTRTGPKRTLIWVGEIFHTTRTMTPKGKKNIQNQGSPLSLNMSWHTWMALNVRDFDYHTYRSIRSSPIESPPLIKPSFLSHHPPGEKKKFHQLWFLVMFIKGQGGHVGQTLKKNIQTFVSPVLLDWYVYIPYHPWVMGLVYLPTFLLP